MMFCGRGMGGGRGGVGGMLRTVGRAVTKVGVAGSGIQEPFSSTATATSKSNSSSRSTSPTSKFTRKPKSSSQLSLSSSVSSHNTNTMPGLPAWHSSSEGDDCDWVSVDRIEDEGIHGFSCPYNFGPIPSEDEVEETVYALKQVFGPASYAQLFKVNCGLDNDMADHVSIPGSQVSTDGSDWVEPTLYPYNSRMLLSDGSDKVYYAFHLLQTEPSVQRMVKSLSSDKAVWEAVLNNEVVRELRESFSAEEQVPQSPNGTSKSDSHGTTNVVVWIFDTAKAKFMEVIEKITKIVNELFQPAVYQTATDAEAPDPFIEKLRNSFMLSIMVLLVVVVSRAHKD